MFVSRLSVYVGIVLLRIDCWYVAGFCLAVLSLTVMGGIMVLLFLLFVVGGSVVVVGRCEVVGGGCEVVVVVGGGGCLWLVGS